MNFEKIATLSMALVVHSSLAANDENVARPNVLLIYADDLGYGDVGCYRYSTVNTPNINSLANNGLTFANGYSVASTSTPSRYSLLTGEYAWRKKGTDVADGNAAIIIAPEKYTVADVFKEAGYATAVFGKWHLGLGDTTGEQNWNAAIAPSPAHLGFDEHYIMAATGDRVPCVFIENGRVSGYDATEPIEVSYKKNFEGEPTGKDNPELLYNLKSSHGHNMSIINGIGRIGYMKGGGSALWKDENIADSITSRAVDFIHSHSAEPFFLYFAANDIHVPRFPHSRFRGKSGQGLRGDAILQLDWSVGQLVSALRECGILENTLVIFTSDNGPVVDDGYLDSSKELLGEHRPSGALRGGKYSAFEGGTRVPFIVSCPSMVEGGVVSDALVSQVDFLATMASLVGIAPPAGSTPDGEDNLAVWLGKGGSGRAFVVSQAANHTLSLRTKAWKYIEPKGGPKMVPWGPEIETGYSSQPQLYDMSCEGEKENLAGKFPQITEVMSAFMKLLKSE